MSVKPETSIFQNIWFKISRVILSIVALGFLFYYVYKNWNNLQTYNFTLMYKWLTVSIFALTVNYYNRALLWFLLNKWSGNNSKFYTLMRGWIYGILGKYLPGKVFYWVSRTQFSAQNLSEAFAIITLSAFEIFLDITSSSLMLIVSLPFLYISGLNLAYSKVIFGGVLLILLPIVRPQILFKIVQKIIRKITKDYTVLEGEFKPRVFYTLLILYFINAVITGCFGFFAFINTFYPSGINNIFYIAFVLAFTSTVSLILFPVPGGIGVRESLFIFLLGKIIPEEAAIIVGLSSRIWTAGAETLVILFWLFLEKTFFKPSS